MFGFLQGILPVGDNFGEVVPGKLYRGAAPDKDLLHALAAMGVKVVIDLRDGQQEDRLAEELACHALGLQYVSLPMSDRTMPSEAQVQAFLTLATHDEPTFVHCEGGRHRTGGMVAAYRVRVQGWSAEQAYTEAKAYHFYSAWGHGPWKTFMLGLSQTAPVK